MVDLESIVVASTLCQIRKDYLQDGEFDLKSLADIRNDLHDANVYIFLCLWRQFQEEEVRRMYIESHMRDRGIVIPTERDVYDRINAYHACRAIQKGYPTSTETLPIQLTHLIKVALIEDLFCYYPCNFLSSFMKSLRCEQSLEEWEDFRFSVHFAAAAYVENTIPYAPFSTLCFKYLEDVKNRDLDADFKVRYMSCLPGRDSEVKLSRYKNVVAWVASMYVYYGDVIFSENWMFDES